MAITETLVAFVAVVGGTIAGSKAVLQQIESNVFKSGVRFERGLKWFISIYLGLFIGTSQMMIGLAMLLSAGESEFIIFEIIFFIDSVPIEVSAIVIVSILLYMILSLEGFSTGIK